MTSSHLKEVLVLLFLVKCIAEIPYKTKSNFQDARGYFNKARTPSIYNRQRNNRPGYNEPKYFNRRPNYNKQETRYKNRNYDESYSSGGYININQKNPQPVSRSFSNYKNNKNPLTLFKRGRCQETSDCLNEGGKCVKDKVFCDQTKEKITKQCTGEDKCACCIPVELDELDECLPTNKYSCKHPNYCKDYFDKCLEGDETKEDACEKHRFLKVLNKIIKLRCKCCVKGHIQSAVQLTSTTGSNKCPICGKSNGIHSAGEKAQRIAGGVVINPPHKYPWLVYIQSVIEGFSYSCGGQIINSRWVLTAAHCFYDGRDSGCNYIEEAEVHVGLHQSDFRDKKFLTGVTRIIQVKDFVEHPGFQCGISHDDDIGLLGLEEELDLFSIKQSEGIKAICLPKDDEGWFEGDQAVAAGWGATASKRSESTQKTMKVPQDVPSEVNIPIKRELCSTYKASWITDNMLCAGNHRKSKDACSGDSGGPLAVKNKNDTYVLAGITSFGPASGDCNGPGVYTRVNQYLEWIAENTKDIPCNMLHDD